MFAQVPRRGTWAPESPKAPGKKSSRFLALVDHVRLLLSVLKQGFNSEKLGTGRQGERPLSSSHIWTQQGCSQAVVGARSLQTDTELPPQANGGREEETKRWCLPGVIGEAA